MMLFLPIYSGNSILISHILETEVVINKNKLQNLRSDVRKLQVHFILDYVFTIFYKTAFMRVERKGIKK